MSARRRRASGDWYQRHVNDPHVREAKSRGYRARSAVKLEQLDRRDRLVVRGMTVVDLGAAPGGWCQYLARTLAGSGRILGVDLLEIEPVDGVDLVRGDFLDPGVKAGLSGLIGPAGADLVLSDMAADVSGVPATDQARMEALFDAVLDFCEQVLRPGGSLVFKAFEGGSANALRDAARRVFRTVNSRKPTASKSQSREFYLVCRQFRG